LGLAFIQISLEKRIRELARYYAELGIEPPSRVEGRSQEFEAQVHAVIDAGAPALSFIYRVPSLEILDECHKRTIRLMGGFSLIPVAADAVEVPVIAAGGIADGVSRGSTGIGR
jgi:nitronate monooxygenase